MKISITLVISCVLGWFLKLAHSSYLYAQVQAETGGDFLTMCRELLESEDN